MLSTIDDRFRFPSIPTVPKGEKSGEMELRSLPSRERDDSFIIGVSLSLTFHYPLLFNALIAAVLCTYILGVYIYLASYVIYIRTFA